jgi:hypothetical protein
MLVYCAWTHFSPRCQYASGFTYFICTNVTIFLFLFLNFYSKSYKGKKNIEKQIKEEYEKTRNGVKSNGVTKTIDVNAQNFKKEENGVHRNDIKNKADLEDDNVPYEVKNDCGDYEKDGKVYLTRRTAKAVHGPNYEFNNIIKK